MKRVPLNIRATAKHGTVRQFRENNQPKFYICTNLGELLRTVKKEKKRAEKARTRK